MAADNFPVRPIKVIVPFSAGGGSDTFARILTKTINEYNLLPAPMVIINVPGAGGVIGSRRVKSALPDGYNLLNLHDGIFTAKYAGTATYGPEAFQPVAGTGSVGLVLAVHEQSLYSTLEELLTATSSAGSKKLSFAANLGAPSHFAGLLIEQAIAGTSFNYVHTGGGAKRFAALTGRHVDTTVFSVSEYLQFREGGIKALAIFSEHRDDSLPNLPTALELGVDVRWSNMQFWWLPLGTLETRVTQIAQAFRAAMSHPSLQPQLQALNIDPVILTGDDLTAEIHRRENLIAAADLRPNTTLPNFATLSLGLLVLTALPVLIPILYRRHNPTQNSTQIPSRTDSMSRPNVLLAGITRAYILILQWTPIHFGLCTFIFLSTSAYAIRDIRQVGWPVVLATAATTSIGLTLLFSQVFLIDLP